MPVIVSRRYRRHRYHKTKLRNPRKTSKTDKELDREMMQLLGNIGSFRNFGNGNPNAIGRALDWISEYVDCLMCGSFLVEMSNQACCKRCFEMWMFMDDGRRCPFCGLQLKDMLNRGQVDILCALVELEKKKLTVNGHYTEDLVKYRIESCNMNIPN
ncbi:uncharacterized protein LOC132920973 [Rhopalosiphum padi]|uniref:uncharacterized protein LOC132920973 n=1 Tax=Rhopalosiphum padi TaxID=40932 RepID=UPI00298DA794|nr:uncharacterized protein LOC132920973 [Rhopalosiphum padi]XP_060839726.1 uncharacterized protein LOC132920973 [Rhopalosiphum padi]